MVFRVFTALYKAFREELKTEKSLKKALLLAARILVLIASLLFTALLLIATLLAEHEGTNTEIMSLYICILYTFFLCGNIVAPWKIISISRKLGITYLVFLLLSFGFFALAQLLSLLFHESALTWNSLNEIYGVHFILLAFYLAVCALFFITYKNCQTEQQKKSLKDELKRLSS